MNRLRNRTRAGYGRFFHSFHLVSLCIFILPSHRGVYGKDTSKPAKAQVKVADDFRAFHITTIRMPDEPGQDPLGVKKAVFDGICACIREVGYEVVVGATNDWSESEAKLDLTIREEKGLTVREDLDKERKNSNDATDGEKYSLSVWLKITAREGSRTKEIYTATCKMWHKYSISAKLAQSGPPVITPTSPFTAKMTVHVHSPVDYSGSGPNTLEKAIPEMCNVLTKKLPIRQ